MRWLLLLALMSCDEPRCSDAPLGAQTCTRIDGEWLLASDHPRQRCGAELLSHPIHIVASGPDLSGDVDGKRLTGVNYASGAFMLSERTGDFTLKGDYRMLDGQPVLQGSAVVGGAGQTCDAMWDFTMYRQ